MSKKMNLKNKKKKHVIKKSLFIMTFLFSSFFTIRLLASISIKNQEDEFLTFLLVSFFLSFTTSLLVNPL